MKNLLSYCFFYLLLSLNGFSRGELIRHARFNSAGQLEFEYVNGLCDDYGIPQVIIDSYLCSWHDQFIYPVNGPVSQPTYFFSKSTWPIADTSAFDTNWDNDIAQKIALINKSDSTFYRIGEITRTDSIISPDSSFYYIYNNYFIKPVAYFVDSAQRYHILYRAAKSSVPANESLIISGYYLALTGPAEFDPVQGRMAVGKIERLEKIGNDLNDRLLDPSWYVAREDMYGDKTRHILYNYKGNNAMLVYSVYDTLHIELYNDSLHLIRSKTFISGENGIEFDNEVLKPDNIYFTDPGFTWVLSGTTGYQVWELDSDLNITNQSPAGNIGSASGYIQRLKVKTQYRISIENDSYGSWPPLPTRIAYLNTSNDTIRSFELPTTASILVMPDSSLVYLQLEIDSISSEQYLFIYQWDKFGNLSRKTNLNSLIPEAWFTDAFVYFNINEYQLDPYGNICVYSNFDQGCGGNFCVYNFFLYLFNLDILTGIKKPANHDASALVYPNPARHSLNFEFKGLPAGHTTLQIYSVHGLQVHESKLATDMEVIDTSNWQPGMYFYIVSKDKQPVVSGKMVIQ